jgi:hypothetical protein
MLAAEGEEVLVFGSRTCGTLRRLDVRRLDGSSLVLHRYDARST